MTAVRAPQDGAGELTRQLRATIHKMEIALGAIGDGVVWVDPGGALEWCNETFERALARPRISILGSPALDLLELEREGVAVGPHDHPVSVAMREGTSPLATYGWRGHGRIVEISATRLQVDGSSSTVIAAVRDVTERVALQRDLERKRAELAEQHQRLVAADSAKSDFLSNLSHELRTPLNGIVGFSELLHDGKAGALTERQLAHARRILESGRHLLGLINDMLAFAQLGQTGRPGRLTGTEPVDLRDLIDQVVGALGETAARKGLSVEIEVGPGWNEIAVDRESVRQILHSFLSNALAFTPGGGHVAVRARDAGAARFRIEVSDDGPGIAPHDLGRLFVDFEQLDAGTAKSHPGTGLGLALAKRIAEALGGEVGVDSAPGQGSTFYAVLPSSPGDASRHEGEPHGG